MDAACHKLQPCSRNQVMMQLLRSEYAEQTEGSLPIHVKSNCHCGFSLFRCASCEWETLTRQALAQGLCCRPKPLVCGVKDAEP